MEKFSEARRVGSLQYRDEREANRFVLAEVFEIKGFLTASADPDFCSIELKNLASTGHLPLPANLARRAPFALPYPCRIVHTIEIESLGLNPAALPAFKLQNAFFEFTSNSRAVRKSLTATFTFSTLTDAVAPGRLPAYKKEADQALSLSSFRVNLPMGYARMRKRSDFGALPPPVLPGNDDQRDRWVSSPPVASTRLVREEMLQTPEPGVELEKAVLIDPRVKSGSRRHRSSRRHSSHSPKSRNTGLGQRKNSEWKWILAAAAVLAMIVLLLTLLVRR